MKVLGILFLIYFCIRIEVKTEEEDKTEMVKMAKEMIRGLAQDCKVEEKATDADIEAMIENSVDASLNSKCVRKCMMKAFNLMEENGNIPIKNVLELAAMLSEGKEDVLETVAEIAEICQNVDDANQCEKAFKFGMCMNDNAMTRKLY